MHRLCCKTTNSDVFAVLYHTCSVVGPAFRCLSVGLSVHRTSQRSEIISASLSVNAVNLSVFFLLFVCGNKKTRHVATFDDECSEYGSNSL